MTGRRPIDHGYRYDYAHLLKLIEHKPIENVNVSR